jgi:molybdopterin synthase sulfur carrier subunit
LPDGSLVRDLILYLGKLNDVIPRLLLRNGDLNENYIVLVNGRDIHWLNGLNTVLRDGDEVLIAPKVFIS